MQAHKKVEEIRISGIFAIEALALFLVSNITAKLILLATIFLFETLVNLQD